MITIYKYTLLLRDEQSVRLPVGAKVLTAQQQGIDICIWAEVDPKARLAVRKFWIVGTGHPVPSSGACYLSTVQMGAFVWHVYTESQ